MKWFFNLFSFHTLCGRIIPAICVNILTVFASGQTDNYFQQEVNYEIQVTLNDRLNELHAFEIIEYINMSPDTLSVLFFHLWANAYSNNNTALAKQLMGTSGRARLFKDPELRGYIDSLDFKIDGRSAAYNFMHDIRDICIIKLDKPAFPGDTLIITTPFRVKIPLGTSSRLGHIGGSYQISQWYPKPAVYDRKGWHPMEYLDQGEFYSDFGRFNVIITLPSDYVVGATGNLINEEETEWLNMLSADTTSRANFYPGNYQSSDLVKHLNFFQENTHDFAWFADKSFHVKRDRLILPGSGKVIETSVMFTDTEADLWENALQYVNEAIICFSGIIGDYPYDTFTAVQAALSSGAGMEYPGLTVVDYSDNAYSLEQVIVHELCHTWFYGALGNDERQYPFLDEGITSAYEQRYMQEKYPEKKAWEIYLGNEKIAKFFNVDDIPAYGIDELTWLVEARKNSDKPVNLPATDYSPAQYGQIIYFKAGMGFNYLRAFLGDSLFDTIMNDYYFTWKFRHPDPDDLRNAFESGAGRNLDWFFDDFLGTTKHADYKIARMRNNQLLIKNKGDMASPLVISVSNNDNQLYQKWSEGFTGKRWIDFPDGKNRNFKIDPFHKMPELYRINNNFRESALFPKADPVNMQFYFTLEDPEKISLMYVPLPNWTRENGFMAGIALHNGFILPERIEYFILPFYSFGNKNPAGLARISYNITPRNSLLRLIKLSIDGSRFGAPGSRQYNRVKIGSTYFLASGTNKSPDHAFYSYYNLVSDLFSVLQNEKADMRSYLQIGYILEKSRLIDPYRIDLALENGKTYGKATVEFNYRYSYYGRNNGLDIRLFSGLMLIDNSGMPYHSFSQSGRSGREQYLYQGIYPDRFAEPVTNFWSRQMSIAEGSLVSPVNDTLGFSPWLISLSFTSSLPSGIDRFPVKPFLNMVLNDPANKTNNSLLYEAGLKTGIWNIFEIHLPLLVSPSAHSGYFRERIRFTLNLDLNSISLF